MTDGGLAVDAIKTIYDFWRVDTDRAQWVGDPSAGGLLRDGYGFDWWPGDFKIAVRVFGPHPELDRPVFRLSVRTDYLCNVDVSTPEFKRLLSNANQVAPTFAICTHPAILPKALAKYGPLTDLGLDLKSSPVWLASAAYLHEGTKDWLPPVFSGFCLLQLIEAQFTAEARARYLGGRADYSKPSGRDSPTSLADILKVEKREVVPSGEQESKWIGTGEFEQIIVNWGYVDSGYGEAFEGGLSIQVPFGHVTAIVFLRTDMRHLRLGYGLHVILKIPYLHELEYIHALSIEMNYIEDRIWSKPGMQFVGNWSAEQWGGAAPGEPDFGPVFNTFIPNLFYQYGLAEILVMDAMRRTKMFREILAPDLIDLPMEEIHNKRLKQEKSR
jgi:hypothetical protein